MFLDPNLAIEQRWITFPSYMLDEQIRQAIQPNAIDFTIDHLSEIDVTSNCFIATDKKLTVHRKQKPVQLHTMYEFNLNYWTIENKSYDFMSDYYLNLPNQVAGLIIIRSTFNRNGMFITSGLWDSGFSGNIAGVIHNNGGPASFEQHVRVGQIMFIKSDQVGNLYSGHYNTTNGQHWSDAIKGNVQ